MSGLDIVRDLFDRWNRADIDGAASIFAGHAHFSGAPSLPDEGVTGRNFIRAFIVATAASSTQLTLLDVAEDGDSVTARFEARSTLMKEYGAERTIFDTRAKITNGEIVELVIKPDESDEQTKRYAERIRAAR